MCEDSVYSKKTFTAKDFGKFGSYVANDRSAKVLSANIFIIL